jgi:hypothetical protein
VWRDSPGPTSDHQPFEMIFSEPLPHLPCPPCVRWDRSPRSQRSVLVGLVRFALSHQIGRNHHYVHCRRWCLSMIFWQMSGC